MIGLGRMGANMAQRLHRGGHRVVGYDPGEGARQRAAEAGLEVVDSLAAAVAALPVPRVVWLMVPAGETVDQTLGQLTPHLAEGDIVIDGGNSTTRTRSVAPRRWPKTTWATSTAAPAVACGACRKVTA